jgi:glycosyltransferase involved in cell wall biosynthesis
MSATGAPLRIVITLPDLTGGGAERLQIGLAARYRRAGHEVTFLLDRRRGELLDAVPEGVGIEVLGVDRQLQALPRLVRWLRQARPDVLIANMEHMSVIAVAAVRVARVVTRVIVCQHVSVSQQITHHRSWQYRVLPAAYGWALPRAHAVVAVSGGVADDLARVARLPRERISVVYNGVIDDDFDQRRSARISHRWLDAGLPVILSVGRLVPLKDHATLIRAFAQIAARTQARLVILGEGPERRNIEALISDLGLGDRIELAGFVANPLPWMHAASLLAVTSLFEGFGNVIAEALACGTPVVSTNCPFGPREILADGAYGRLVPVGDAAALAAALLESLAATPDRERLQQRGQAFTLDACAAGYLALMRPDPVR